MLLVWSLRAGLSPRVRGNRRQQQNISHRGGSIPACAGEPPSRMMLLNPPRVYPRVCGGTQRPGGMPAPTCGLSPRVRGNPSSSLLTRLMLGSIPACAGEPSQPPAS